MATINQSLISTGAFSPLLVEGLISEAIGAGLDNYPAIYKKLFTIRMTDQFMERIYRISPMMYPQQMNEGQDIPMQGIKGDTLASVTQVQQGTSFAMTYLSEKFLHGAKGIESVVEYASSSMLAKLQQQKEIIHNSIFNNAYTANPLPQFYVPINSEALVSTTHTLPNGQTLANTNVNSISLSLDAVMDSYQQIRRWVDNSGSIIDVGLDQIMVPPELEARLSTILDTPLQPDSSNNNINVMRSLGIFPGGRIINQYLTSTTGYYFTTSLKEGGLTSVESVAPDLTSYVDQKNRNRVYSVVVAYSMYYGDFRCIWGNQGTVSS